MCSLGGGADEKARAACEVRQATTRSAGKRPVLGDGRLLREEPKDKTGPAAPVEPTRIDRIFPPNEPAGPGAQGA
jgi:hypothetical protein